MTSSFVDADTEIELGGESIILLPEKAALWPSRSTLLVADLHLGKAAAFRAGGIPIPLGETDDALNRLGRVVERTGVERVVVLGDLWHARAGMTSHTLEAFADWRQAHQELDLCLILGNHDRKLTDALHNATGLAPLHELREGPFYFCHEPCEEHTYSLGGHIHPGVRLGGRGRQTMKVPCFWFRETGGVLPAFGPFTGLGLIAPQAGDRVYLVGRPGGVGGFT